LWEGPLAAMFYLFFWAFSPQGAATALPLKNAFS